MKIFFLIIVLTAWHPSIEWKTLENSEFLIKYPDNWTLDQSGTSGTKFILFSPASSGQTFRNNVNLIIQDLAGSGIDLKKYTEISINQVQQLITSAKILHSKLINSAYELVYTGMYGEYNLKWKQYFWVKNEKAYILTFTADQNSFEKDLDLANQIMSTFEIKAN